VLYDENLFSTCMTFKFYIENQEVENMIKHRYDQEQPVT